jgi:aryl-alcohol dehydrogenase-like predicted oxidoreductase
VLAQPGVTAAIAGSGSVVHTAENAQAGSVDLRDVLPELERLVGLGPAFIAD